MERYRRYGIDTRAVKKVLDGFSNAVRLVDDGGDFCEIPADPSDEKFTAAALRASADFIVSEDEHLLGLRSCRGVPIVVARAFVAEMRARGVML